MSIGQEIGVVIAVLSFLAVLLTHLVMVAKAWGSFKAIIEKLEAGSEKLERLIEALFAKTEEHGNRLTAVEKVQEIERRSAERIHH
jgi:predicted PurR-regulated permease PerM